MTLFNASQQSAGVVAGNVQQRLKTFRDSILDIHALFVWSQGVTQTDLTGLGFSTGDATALQTAIADANALYVLYNTGQLPSTYPQAASVYPYSANVAEVIGPQL